MSGEEKHRLIVAVLEGEVEVKVGAIQHPMERDHHIVWVELITDKEVYRKRLEIGDKPEVRFGVKDEKVIKARAYCSLHGLWSLM